MDFLLVRSGGSAMCSIRFIFFHPDNHGGKLELPCPFLKGGNGGPKSLGDLLELASRLTAEPSQKLRLPALTSVLFPLYQGFGENFLTPASPDLVHST